MFLLDKSNNVYIYPNNENAIADAERIMEKMSLCHILKDKNIIIGNKFIPKKLTAIESWRINFGNAGEEIVGYASDDQLGLDQYQGIIENDGNIVYKFVDSNLMAVATYTAEKQLNIYVLNRINGAILYVGHVYNVQGIENLKIRLAENIIMVNYLKLYDERAITLLNEILTIEMFYPTIENDVKNMLAQHYSKGIQIGGTDSCKLPTPKFLVQTYVIPVAIKDLLITRTLQGVTNKKVILLTVDNKLLGIPEVLLSARRPTNNPDRDEAEFEDATITPYDAVMQITFTVSLNYNLPLSGITKLKSLPQLFESTTLILGSGIDIFAIHFTPDKVRINNFRNMMV